MQEDGANFISFMDGQISALTFDQNYTRDKPSAPRKDYLVSEPCRALLLCKARLLSLISKISSLVIIVLEGWGEIDLSIDDSLTLTSNEEAADSRSHNTQLAGSNEGLQPVLCLSIYTKSRNILHHKKNPECELFSLRRYCTMI